MAHPALAPSGYGGLAACRDRITVDQVVKELAVRQPLLAEAEALALAPGKPALHVERLRRRFSVPGGGR